MHEGLKTNGMRVGGWPNATSIAKIMNSIDVIFFGFLNYVIIIGVMLISNNVTAT